MAKEISQNTPNNNDSSARLTLQGFITRSRLSRRYRRARPLTYSSI